MHKPKLIFVSKNTPEQQISSKKAITDPHLMIKLKDFFDLEDVPLPQANKSAAAYEGGDADDNY